MLTAKLKTVVFYIWYILSCFSYIFIEQPYKDATTGICMGGAYTRDNNTCAVVFIKTIGGGGVVTRGALSRGGAYLRDNTVIVIECYS